MTSRAQGLESIYDKAREFIEGSFGVDFPQDILGDAELWEGIRNHKGSKGIIIPLSNTMAARQMRVAAALAILSTELSLFIFQGTYSIGSTDELSVLLNKLAAKDPEAESHLRSVLLAATPESQYEENAEEWGKKAVKSLTTIMKPLFQKGSPDRARFRDGLQDICDQALALWRSAQRVEGRVMPDFELEYDGEEPVTLVFQLATLTETFGKNPHQNGTYPPLSNGNQINGTDKTSQGNHSKPPPQSLVTSPPEPYVVVWPEFYTVTGDQQVSLTPARVVSQAHLNAAREEEKARIDANSRRTQRGNQRKARTMSTSESVGSPGGSNGDVSATSPTPSKSFLFQRIGGGRGND